MAVFALVASALLCIAAVATISGERATALVDEVDGLELNAYLTPSDVDEFKKLRSEQEQMDAQIGRLRQFLVDTGLANDTLLWFTSDNGATVRSQPATARRVEL